MTSVRGDDRNVIDYYAYWTVDAIKADLDTKRLVIWDMGAIASRGTPEARCLYIDCLMASSAVPGFFPSVRFNTAVDGQAFEELHVDGGVSRAIFSTGTSSQCSSAFL